MRMRRVLAVSMAMVVGCHNAPPKTAKRSPDTIRYRLLIRDNPVSPTDAAHCFSECQAAATPNAYVDCLSQCPGFETTPGEYCSKTEVPPEAACLTVTKIPANKEPPPGAVVLAIVGDMALVVGAATLCTLSTTRCGINEFAPH